jgi:hypothetical protein
MGRRTFAWFAAVWLLGSPALAQHVNLRIEEPSVGVTVFTFSNARYGSLEFDGSIERVDFGEEWEFRAHINVTFHANTKPNLVESVDLTGLQFVVMGRPDGPTSPWSPVIKRIEPVALHLSIDGERGSLRDVAFRVPKDVVASAQHTELDVTNGRRLWPIAPLAVELASLP